MYNYNMNKKTLTLLFSFIPLLSLSSCSEKVSYIDLMCGNINPYTGTYHACDKQGNLLSDEKGTIAPFNTSIQLRYYGYGNQDKIYDKELESDFYSFFKEKHAYFDRHNYYYSSSDRKVINNLKTINDSYGSNQEITLEESFYNSLKKALDFSIHSKDKFNIGIGSLSLLWDAYLDMSSDYTNSSVKDRYLESSILNRKVMFDDPLDEEINFCKDLTLTSQELNTYVQLNDINKSVIFKNIPRIDEVIKNNLPLIESLKEKFNIDLSKPSLTLGGFGKGEATELFKRKYPNKNMFINSGTSSISCIGSKLTSSKWEFSLSNPLYYQEERVGINYLGGSKYSPSDLIMFKEGTFSMSTSGSYNAYFYNKDNIIRHHIIDSLTGYSHTYFSSVTVFIEDGSYGDMITTSLMNTSSLEEANILIGEYKNYLNMDIIPVYLINNSNNTVNCYAPKEEIKNIKISQKEYPSYYQKESVTTIVEL